MPHRLLASIAVPTVGWRGRYHTLSDRSTVGKYTKMCYSCRQIASVFGVLGGLQEESKAVGKQTAHEFAAVMNSHNLPRTCTYQNNPLSANIRNFLF